MQPFERIVDHIDRRSLPTLDESIRRHLNVDSGEIAGTIEYRVRLIDARELAEFNQLNREIFAYSAFSLPLSSIRRRNEGIFLVNRSCFALVEAVSGSGFMAVGVSHVIPLNELGAALYVRDQGLRDGELTGRHVAEPGE
jgi:hypothetical protein